jgi:hypothetical protein
MSDNFCSRLLALLEERNISRNDLTKLGYEGLSYRKVHAYCTGETPPPVEFLAMLGGMGFDLHHLLLGTPVIGVAQAAAAPPAALLAQLEGVLRSTRQVLARMTPATSAPALSPEQLSHDENRVIAALRAMPEKTDLVLAMLTPCPRCASQNAN